MNELLRKKLSELADHLYTYAMGCDDDGAEQLVKEARQLLETEQSPTRVIVEVAGGVVQAAYATEPVSVDVLDHDNWKSLSDSSERPEEYDRYCALQTEIDKGELQQTL